MRGRPSAPLVLVDIEVRSQGIPPSLQLPRKPSIHAVREIDNNCKCRSEVMQKRERQSQGGDSIDILDGLNPCLNPSLNHFSIHCLPKRVLNLVLNPSLKFLVSIELHPWQKGLSSHAIPWNIQTLVNPTKVYDQMGHHVPAKPPSFFAAINLVVPSPLVSH